MITFTALFASCSVVLLLLWLAERQELRFWREQAKQWKGRADRGWAAWNEARIREEFWMAAALRSPLHGKPKEVPRA